MKFNKLSEVNPVNFKPSQATTQFLDSQNREFEMIDKKWPRMKTQLGPGNIKSIYTDGFKVRTFERPIGTMYDADLSAFRNTHLGDLQSKTYGFLGYPYHSYNVNERVTIRPPVQIEFGDYKPFVNNSPLKGNR